LSPGIFLLFIKIITGQGTVFTVEFICLYYINLKLYVMADYNQNRSQQYSGFNEDRDQDSWRQNRNRNQNQDYDDVNYRQGNYDSRSSYNRNNENEYSQGGYGVRNRNYGAYEENTYNRQGDYNSPYGKTSYANDEYGAPEAFTGNRDYYGGGHGYMGGYDYHIADENRYRSNQQRPYRNTDANRGERDWWDRTRDEVSSWFGDDEAERRRERDRRISDSHKGKGPRGYTRSTERIKEDVCERLSEDDYVDASDIDIRMEGSEVILSGTVHSRAEKRRAEDLVESISGVSNVQNQLRVAKNEYSAASDVRTTDTSRR
jgi:osmotically-inducible protein OsmY